MSPIDCTNCQKYLPDLLLEPEAAPAVALDHLAACADCSAELRELQATMTLMDAWTAPEPSAFFDTRLYARVRAEQNATTESFWQRVSSYLHGGHGRGLRPAMVGALGCVMLLGGGTAATWISHHWSGSSASSTVNDLKIYDNNAQAVDQMDLLDDAGASSDEMPQS